MPRKTNIDTVEQALDRYVASMAKRGMTPQGFRAVTLAKLIGEDSGRMSTRLQQYRGAQARPNGQQTRYVLGATSYGPEARWSIVAKPGDDPAHVRRARRRQAVHIFTDAHARMVSDLVHELYPALSDSQADRAIADLTEFARKQAEVIVDHVATVMERRVPRSALVSAATGA